jgi:hypothetical protein
MLPASWVDRGSGFDHQNVKPSDTFSFPIGVILEKTENEGAIFGGGRRVVTVKVPQ